MSAPSPELVRLIRQLETTTDLSDADRKALGTLPFRTRTIAERRDIIRENSQPVESCLVVEGMLCRYKMLSNGRRQILSFHLPGDMPDLQSLHLTQMDHAVASVTSSKIALIPHDAVRALARTRRPPPMRWRVMPSSMLRSSASGSPMWAGAPRSSASRT